MNRALYAIALLSALAGCERKATQVPTIATESTASGTTAPPGVSAAAPVPSTSGPPTTVANVFGPGATKLREASSDEGHPFDLGLRRRLLEKAVGSPNLKNRDVTVAGNLPPEVITRILRQELGRVRACYEAALKRDPDLEGAAGFRFVIESDGAVSSATATTPTLSDAAMMTCVTNVLRKTAFPNPEAGKVTVSFVTTFASE